MVPVISRPWREFVALPKEPPSDRKCEPRRRLISGGEQSLYKGSKPGRLSMSEIVDRDEAPNERNHTTTSSHEDQAVLKVVADVMPLLARTNQEHALARYVLGQKVNELDNTYGESAVSKLARKLGHGFGADYLRVFARIARTWTRDAFTELASEGLAIEHFRELAKVKDAETRARVEQQAAKNSWSMAKLKKAIRRETKNEHTSNTTHDNAETELTASTMTVIEALNAIITVTHARKTEQVRLREHVNHIDARSAHAMTAEINQALESLSAQRAAIEETERLLAAALRLPTGIAA